MLKRKYGNRSGWSRILEKEYSQQKLNSEEFNGYITLLHTKIVACPLWVKYTKEKICIVDNGYMWLQHFPIGKNYSLTTMFDSKGEIVQWYIDISYRNSTENNIPFMEDLYLDLIVLPNGTIIEKDAGELEAARLSGLIEQELYDLAWQEFNHVKNQLHLGSFQLMKLSQKHKELLEKELLRP